MHPVLKQMLQNMALSFVVLLFINLVCFAVIALFSNYGGNWDTSYDNFAFSVNGVTAGLPSDTLPAKVLVATLFVVLTLKEHKSFRTKHIEERRG